MTEDQSVDPVLGFIEGVNNLADAMDTMKQAMESRGWSTAQSEQIGAHLGIVLMNSIAPPPPPQKGKR